MGPSNRNQRCSSPSGKAQPKGTKTQDGCWLLGFVLDPSPAARWRFVRGAPKALAVCCANSHGVGALALLLCSLALRGTSYGSAQAWIKEAGAPLIARAQAGAFPGNRGLLVQGLLRGFAAW